MGPKAKPHKVREKKRRNKTYRRVRLYNKATFVDVLRDTVLDRLRRRSNQEYVVTKPSRQTTKRRAVLSVDRDGVVAVVKGSWCGGKGGPPTWIEQDSILGLDPEEALEYAVDWVLTGK